MILENQKDRLMMEEILDVILRAKGKDALAVAQYLIDSMQRYDNKAKEKKDGSDKDGAGELQNSGS